MNRLSLRALALLAGAVVAAAGCADGNHNPTAARPAGEYHLLRRAPDTFGPRRSESGTSSVSAVIGPDGGTLQMDGGYRIDFPAGALAQPTTITMTPSAQYVGVELEPHGITFPAGHQPLLTIGYGGANLLGLSNLAIVYVNDANQILEVLPTVWNFRTHSLSARLQHFSGYLSGGT